MQLVQLMEYKTWANKILFESVSTLPDEKLNEPQPIVFGSLANTLHHVFAVDRIFKAHLTSEPHGYTTRRPKDSPPIGELWQSQIEIDAWYEAYSRQLTEEKQSEVVEFQFVGGGDGAMSREEILLHIVNHGTYHRGHIGTMLFNMDVEPTATDYTVFVRDVVRAG